MEKIHNLIFSINKSTNNVNNNEKLKSRTAKRLIIKIFNYAPTKMQFAKPLSKVLFFSTYPKCRINPSQLDAETRKRFRIRETLIKINTEPAHIGTTAEAKPRINFNYLFDNERRLQRPESGRELVGVRLKGFPKCYKKEAERCIKLPPRGWFGIIFVLKKAAFEKMGEGRRLREQITGGRLLL